MPLIDALTTFRGAVAEANSFITLAFKQDTSGNYILSANQQDFLTDSAYLRVFIAWETFLENTFVRYMLGEHSILGNIVTSYVRPLDDQHANRLLIGTQKFVDWSDPQTVKKLCNLYFSPGNPIDTFVSSMASDLSDLKTIRNAAAHLSSTTRKQLDALGTRKLKKTCTNLKVSDYILAVDPVSKTNDTILTSYLNLLDVCAEGIANG